MAHNLIKILITIVLFNNCEIVNSKPVIESTTITINNDVTSQSQLYQFDTTTTTSTVELTTELATTEATTTNHIDEDWNWQTSTAAAATTTSDENLQTTTQVSSTINTESYVEVEKKSDNNNKNFENIKFPDFGTTVSSEEEATTTIVPVPESTESDNKQKEVKKQKSVNGNSTQESGGSAKRAKFLNVDEHTNLNTRIPDNTEVWALASGLWAPSNTNNRSASIPKSQETANNYLNEATSSSPESLLAKWSEVMKIMDNKTENQTGKVLVNNNNEINVSPNPNLDSNRIDLDNQEQRINETVLAVQTPKNQNYKTTSARTVVETLDATPSTSETNRNLEQMRISETENILDVETTTTMIETIETTTAENHAEVTELTTESNGITTEEPSATEYSDYLTLFDEEADAMDGDATTTELPVTSTEINPSINEIPESTERYNKSSTQKSLENATTTMTAEITARSLETTTLVQPTTSTTTSSIIEFKPMSSESPKIPRVENDTNHYEYSTVENYDLLPQSSSTAFTTELPPSTFSYQPKSPLDPNDSSSSVFQETTPANDNDSLGLGSIITISICVTCAVILVLIAVFWIFVKKRKNHLSNIQRCKPVNLDQYSLDNISLNNSVRRKANVARLSKRSYGNSAFEDPALKSNSLDYKALIEFVKHKTQIYDEFKDIPQVSIRVDEIPDGCEDKNRYANVIPFPETRVHLKRLSDDDEKSEYINANFIKGPKDAFSYIATQAPLDNTIADFWRMIWEQNSKVIVCLTDLTENGVEKCAEYIPPSTIIDNNRTFGDFQVTLKSREVKDRYAVSTVHLRNSKTSTWREIMHLWYDWPENGCPTDANSIISLLLEARAYVKSSLPEKLDENFNSETIEKAEKLSTLDKTKSLQRTQGPLTVHCSPGTGRTGTVVACDIILRQLETPPRKIDVPQIVYLVRRCRSNAIRAKEQYEFIYKVASTYATKLSNPTVEN